MSSWSIADSPLTSSCLELAASEVLINITGPLLLSSLSYSCLGFFERSVAMILSIFFKIGAVTASAIAELPFASVKLWNRVRQKEAWTCLSSE